MPNPGRTMAEMAETIAQVEKHGGIAAAAKALGLSRNTMQSRYEIAKTKMAVPDYNVSAWTFPPNKDIELFSGSMVISSDHHYWPGEPPLAHLALLKVIRIVKPRVKILNGDVFDGASISRHPPAGWAERPSPVEELEVCQERIGEIEQALPKGCERLWAIGNHDERFEKNIAVKAPELAGLKGLRLADHFPGWEMYRRFRVNWGSQFPTVVFHNYANGVHAGYNNAMKSGVTTVTGHTHALECKPYHDLRGRRYGVQTGTVSDLDGPQFEYQGGRPSQACSGFAVLTYSDGILLQPELCQVVDGKAYFRGDVVA